MLLWAKKVQNLKLIACFGNSDLLNNRFNNKKILFAGRNLPYFELEKYASNHRPNACLLAIINFYYVTVNFLTKKFSSNLQKNSVKII